MTNPIGSESILNTIKTMLGLESDYTAFDTEILNHINSVFTTLTQIGVGATTGFYITGPTETWLNFVTDVATILSVKTYIYLKVKLLFDPPASSFVLDALSRQASEIEWRLQVKTDVSTIVVEEVSHDGDSYSCWY